MHSAPGGVQPDCPRDNCTSVVSDLVSLIEHMQASMKMLEGAIARELPLAGQDADDNVIILDDITPCYVKANAVLHACKASLAAALHSLSGAEPSDLRLVGLTGSDRRVAPQQGSGEAGRLAQRKSIRKPEPESDAMEQMGSGGRCLNTQHHA